MINLKKIKVAFIDVDGTLAIPRFSDMDGVVSCSVPDDYWFDICNYSSDVYKHCERNERLVQFLQILKDNNVRLYVLTEENNSGAYFNKVDFVLSEYPEFFTDYRQVLFVDDKSKKKEIMRVMRNRLGVVSSQCLLVDDTYSVCHQVNQEGFNALHISELFTDWWC